MRSAAIEPRVEGGCPPAPRPPCTRGTSCCGTGSCLLGGVGRAGCARRRRGPTKQPGRRSPPSTRPCRGRSRRRRAPGPPAGGCRSTRSGWPRAASAAPRAAPSGRLISRFTHAPLHAHWPSAGAPLGREDLDRARPPRARRGGTSRSCTCPRRRTARAHGSSTASSSRAQRLDQVRLEACGALVERQDARHGAAAPRTRPGRACPPPSLSLPASAENIATNGQYGLRGSVRHDTPAPHEPAHQRGAHRMRLPRCRPGARRPS